MKQPLRVNHPKRRIPILLPSVLALLLLACRFSAGNIPPENPPARQTDPAPAPAIAESPGAADISQPAPTFDIPYSSDPNADPKRNMLDIYPAPGSQSQPVVIYLHGGGWQAGDKRNVDTKPQAFNENGYVFVSVNYRLIPQVDLPTQAGDIAQAIAWISANIAQYGGDPAQISLMGHSAGAHLVSLVAVDPAYLQAQGLSLESLKAVVALDTQAYDVPMLMEKIGAAGEKIYRQAFGSDPEIWQKLSPLYHVHEWQRIPAFIVAYSGAGQERKIQAERFVERLENAGVTCELLPAPEKTHAEINREFGLSGDDVTEAVFAFLRGRLVKD